MIYYVVVKTTPEHNLFNSYFPHTYKAITKDQYDLEWNKWYDRLYCGCLSKKHANSLVDHLNG